MHSGLCNFSSLKNSLVQINSKLNEKNRITYTYSVKMKKITIIMESNKVASFKIQFESIIAITRSTFCFTLQQEHYFHHKCSVKHRLGHRLLSLMHSTSECQQICLELTSINTQSTECNDELYF